MCKKKTNYVLNHFHIIAFTHRNLDINDIGKLHIEAEKQQERLQVLKQELNVSELMFLSTCNRVEFIFCTAQEIEFQFLMRFFQILYPTFST